MKRISHHFYAHTLPMVIVLALVASTVFSQTTPPSNNANISLYPQPYQLGNIVFHTPSGQTISLKDYQGKVVILHFWSINCPACRMEEPMLVQLKQSMAPRGLEILAVNFVDPPQAISQYVATKRPPFPVLQKGASGFDLKVVKMGDKTTAFVVNPAREAILEVPGFPTNYIVDCRGGVIGYSVGAARWDSAYALSLLEKLLNPANGCVVGSLPDRLPQRVSIRWSPNQ